MNSPTLILSEPAAQMVRKSCYQCGYIRATCDQTCADCGKTLESVSRIKITGAIQTILGSVLLIFMGWFAAWILNPNANNHFDGNANDVLFVIFIFGLIVAISLGVMAAGIWQIVFGKRNKLLMLAMIGLGIIFAATGFSVLLYK